MATVPGTALHGQPSESPPASEAELAARLRLAVTRLNRPLRQQVVRGCTPSQVSALACASRLGSPTLGELAAAEGVQPPSMTRVVDALERARLMARVVDPDDGRVVRVKVSRAGEHALAKIRSMRNALLAKRLRRLDDDERRRLAELVPLLERLVGDG